MPTVPVVLTYRELVDAGTGGRLDHVARAGDARAMISRSGSRAHIAKPAATW